MQHTTVYIEQEWSAYDSFHDSFPRTHIHHLVPFIAGPLIRGPLPVQS